MTANDILKIVGEDKTQINHLRPIPDPETLVHRKLPEGPFWQKIPAYANVDEETFLDHKWQAKNSLTKPKKLIEAFSGLVSQHFIEDVRAGFEAAPMAVRVSPYLLSLINWDEPYGDPLIRQFIPLQSRRLPNHPQLGLDSLAEQADAPVPGLTHRYPDKALFLPLDTCPVYCRFCTRSYAVGLDTPTVDKVNFGQKPERWELAFQYINSRPELEDIVVSGGDAFNLRADRVQHIGDRLLDIDHIRRIRIATKGIAVMPQKILTDHEWRDALLSLVKKGRERHKEVCLHTHFNNPDEITWITRKALNVLTENGVTVRNQSVLQRGVNDDVETMVLLGRRLGYINVQPYYVYVHDLVPKVEDLRTTLQTALDIEKHVRGTTAGFNTPTFVVDAPGGGGKRNAHSFEHYDRVTGISVFTAPSVRPGQFFLYFDPIHLLPEEGQVRWANPMQHQRMIDEALDRARAKFHGPSS
ncbi:MAG: lysine 2,3-aminomutase [Myxococcales bacterium]|nr:lysine 2,3-aminomutase [Myxococcales bacterium]